MSFDTAIESATRDHKALYEIDPQNQPEMQKALGLFKSSMDNLSKAVAERAFQDGRSKRKQWGEIQKQLTDLSDDGRELAEREEPVDAEMAAKIDVRYQRIHSRLVNLGGS